jgi:hypothetical protein
VAVIKAYIILVSYDNTLTRKILEKRFFIRTKLFLGTVWIKQSPSFGESNDHSNLKPISRIEK